MFALTRLSLVATFIVLTLITARMLGILEKKYYDTTMYVILAIQLIILVVLVIIFVLKRRKMSGVRIIRYQVQNKFIKGDTNIIPEYISSTNTRKSAVFTVLLQIENVTNTPEVVISKMMGEKKLTNIKDHIITVDAGIVENCFMFHAEVVSRPGEKINFNLSKDATVKLFFLGELYIP